MKLSIHLQTRLISEVALRLLFIVIAGLMLPPVNLIAQNLDEQRVIIKKSDFNPPLTIALVKARGVELETNRPFLNRDDEWFKNLEIEVRNDSQKTVTYISIDLTFRRTRDQQEGMPAGWPLQYGIDPFRYESAALMPAPTVAPLTPGASVSVSLSDPAYHEMKRFLDDSGFPARRKRLEIRILKIGFSDGSAWNAGRTYLRLPQPYKWWNSTDAREVDMAPRQKTGRTLGNPRLFLNVRVTDNDLLRYRRFSHFVRAVNLTSHDCGHALIADVNCNMPGFECRYEEAELYENPDLSDAIDPKIMPCMTIINGQSVADQTELRWK